MMFCAQVCLHINCIQKALWQQILCTKYCNTAAVHKLHDAVFDVQHLSHINCTQRALNSAVERARVVP